LACAPKVSSIRGRRHDSDMQSEKRKVGGQHRASGHRLADVTVIVTKTPRNEPDVVRRAETARCRRLRRAGVCATGRDGVGRRPPDS
jgi:hypothetical protein